MTISNHNSLSFLFDWRMLVLLALVVCAGCQTRISQLELGQATNDSVTEIKPIQSPTNDLSHEAEDANTAMQKFADPEDKDTPRLREATTATTPTQTATKQSAAPNQPKPKPVADKQITQAKQRSGSAAEPKPEPDIKTETPKKLPRVVAKKPAIVERNGKIYQPYHLNKNQTLLLLAAQPDIRSEILASTVREVATPEQQIAAEKLASTFDQQYVEILRQRAAILESAVDGANVEAKLLDLRMTTADLTTRVRTKINEEILTQAQRFELQRLFEESQK